MFWIFLVLVIYFFLIFVVLRLVVPFIGFGKFKMPAEVPSEIQHKIKELESQSHNQSQYLENAYNFIISRWQAGRLDTVLQAPLAFRKDISKIWQRPGYAHCNTQNYLLFVLLVGSKFFQAKDVQPHCVFFNFFIHQYLKVRIGETLIEVDPAGTSIRGLPLGSHIEWFG